MIQLRRSSMTLALREGGQARATHAGHLRKTVPLSDPQEKNQYQTNPREHPHPHPQPGARVRVSGLAAFLRAS
ncbi:hypothetical protein E2C01_081280 [Portunus trituberculatus]|uniref:Uncharacterized protein n=1 Tax=Portunus trituberculatus TaxID=210409 RepID=A0A5B7ILT7_PORTR|nr:hypothetical protein [Portunus trituberculatus]